MSHKPNELNTESLIKIAIHSFLLGADLAPLIREFINKKSTLVRGLAHPVIFAAGNQVEGNGSQMSQFKKFGAVKVSPSSILEVRSCR